jgi:hypothetical protein
VRDVNSESIFKKGAENNHENYRESIMMVG